MISVLTSVYSVSQDSQKFDNLDMISRPIGNIIS